MKYDVLFKTTKMALNTLFLADQISDEHAVWIWIKFAVICLYLCLKHVVEYLIFVMNWMTMCQVEKNEEREKVE